jgi:dihydrodipicolinate synthase/N-acetylneuraminate lyase
VCADATSAARHRKTVEQAQPGEAQQGQIWPLCQFLEPQSYPAAVKTACRLIGDDTGPVRAPLLPLDDVATRELADLLEQATVAGSRHRPRLVVG